MKNLSLIINYDASRNKTEIKNSKWSHVFFLKKENLVKCKNPCFRVFNIQTEYRPVFNYQQFP